MEKLNLLQSSTNIAKMNECSISVYVSFSAESVVSAEAEFVENAALFRADFFYLGRPQSFKLFELSIDDMEIGDNGDK